MRLFVPSYYPRFQCRAGACRHSCCVGWEIDIDEETRTLYERMPGEIGEHVRRSLETKDGVTCFRLGAGERCPHLNADGLCNIILEAGEEYLSQICDDHPRFRSYFSDRVEMGLGLTCEAAAELILGDTTPATLVAVEDDGEREEVTAWEYHVLTTRDHFLALARNRELSFRERLVRMVAPGCRLSLSDFAAHLMTLERLDPAWDGCLAGVTGNAEPEILGTSRMFSTYDIAMEQLLVYLLLRHISDAEGDADLRARILFCAMTCRLIDAIARRHAETRGRLTLADLAEYARMWSSEIEYSTENTDACLAYLAEAVI